MAAPGYGGGAGLLQIEGESRQRKRHLEESQVDMTLSQVMRGDGGKEQETKTVKGEGKDQITKMARRAAPPLGWKTLG